MRRGMSNLRILKVRLYTDCLIDLNKFLAFFLGAKLTVKFGVAKINEILFNIIPNSWSTQAYLQVFDCEYIDFKIYFNMFECMDIVESIYEGVVEPYYKKSLGYITTMLVAAG